MLKLYYYKVVRMLRLISKEAYKQKRNLLLIQQSKYFDREWYRDQYPDVRASKMDPAKHYLEYGWKEMRRPSLYFSTYAYFKANPDVQAAYINPLLHYILSGAKEGRSLGMRLPQIKKGFQFKRNLIWRLLCPLVCRNRESDLRILVVLHLFYPEEWVKIEEYLMTLKSYKVTLKVTVTEGFTDENVLAQIRAFMPACEIITLPNIGFDVAPFIYILNQIDLSQYDIVYKLQSKGVNKAFRYIYGQVFKYQDWFLNLYRGIFGLFRTHKIIKMFEANPKLGLVAADNLIIEDPIYKKAFTQKIAAQYGISLRDDYRYVAGTCFVARAKCLKPIQDLNLKLSDFEITRRGLFSTAHAFERIICAIIENDGYIFKGMPTRRRKHSVDCKRREKYSSQRLLKDPRFEIDYEYFYRALESRSIYDYEIVSVRLGDIKRRWVDGSIYDLTEVAPFRYLNEEEGREIYSSYCEDNFEKTGFQMSLQRFDSLIESIEAKGFDSKFLPVIHDDNVIGDGQHRCCILLHKYGPDFEIKAVKIRFKRNEDDKVFNRICGELSPQTIKHQCHNHPFLTPLIFLGVLKGLFGMVILNVKRRYKVWMVKRSCNLNQLKRIKPLALYLPQYHRIPENDAWWGKGFTEWTNVKKAKPLFEGHYQPHIPHPDVGYYDLADVNVMRKQVRMAKEYGIYGFCFYYYHFANGKRLLEKPLNNYLAAKDIDFPFCYAWANENWTRARDGGEKEVICPQNYEEENMLTLITEMIPAFKDKRYIKIDGKPVLFVYRAEIVPCIKELANKWKSTVRSAGFDGLYLISMQHFKAINPFKMGFDAAAEFAPEAGKPICEVLSKDEIRFFSSTSTNYCSMENIIRRMTFTEKVSYPRMKCICPSWDNSPRRGARASRILFHANPTLFKRFFEYAVYETIDNGLPCDGMLLINAWNEWGEGAHLEPDEKFGYGWLESIQSVLCQGKSRHQEGRQP